MSAPAKKRLGELLVEAGIIDETQLKAALGHQRQWGVRLGQALVDMKLATEHDVVKVLARRFGFEVARLDQIEAYAHQQAVSLVPREFALKHNVFPIAADTATLTVAMSDPTNLAVVDELRFRSGRRVKVTIGGDREVSAAIQAAYPSPDGGVEAIALDIDEGGADGESVMGSFGGGSAEDFDSFFGAGAEAPQVGSAGGPVDSPFEAGPVEAPVPVVPAAQPAPAARPAPVAAVPAAPPPAAPPPASQPAPTQAVPAQPAPRPGAPSPSAAAPPRPGAARPAPARAPTTPAMPAAVPAPGAPSAPAARPLSRPTPAPFRPAAPTAPAPGGSPAQAPGARPAAPVRAPAPVPRAAPVAQPPPGAQPPAPAVQQQVAPVQHASPAQRPAAPPQATAQQVAPDVKPVAPARPPEPQQDPDSISLELELPSADAVRDARAHAVPGAATAPAATHGPPEVEIEEELSPLDEEPTGSLPLGNGEQAILAAIERLADGGHAEPEVLKPTQAIAVLIRILLRKGIVSERELLDALRKP